MYICIMKKSGIYKIKSIKTNRIYIGSAINISLRWKRHKRDLTNSKHHSTFLQRHFNKYGIDDLEFSIIELCEIDNLIEREQFYLDNNECHFNNAIKAGSTLGSKRNEEQVKAMSKRFSGEGNPTYGLERTEEWRKNISEANKGQKAWNKGLKNIYSEETLEKMRKPKIKKKCEYCGKDISLANYKRWHGENCKRNFN